MNLYELQIDSREHKLIELLKEVKIKNFEIVTKQLKLGDIVIKRKTSDNSETNNSETNNSETNNSETNNDCSDTILIFERKTTQDLLASINDGRYKEQNARLCSNYDKTKICYLIENSINSQLSKYRKNGKQIVIGALVNKMCRDNIKILRTDSLEQSIEFLLNICKKVVEKPEFFKTESSKNTNILAKNTNTSSQLDSNYTETIKITKKDNINKNTFGLISLTIIPGVSSNIAKLIIEKYGSLNELIVKINKEPSQVSKDIADIKLTTTTGKQRRFGSKLADKIIEILQS